MCLIGPLSFRESEQMEEGKSGAGQGMGAAWGRGRVQASLHRVDSRPD